MAYMLAERATAMIAPRDVNKKDALLGPSLTLNTLCAIAVVCRIYIRCIRKNTAGLDDICIVIALVSLNHVLATRQSSQTRVGSRNL